jgi:hypothetical protein
MREEAKGDSKGMAEMSEFLELETVDGLVEELRLGSARGGKRIAEKVDVAQVRGLEDKDMELILNPPVVGGLPSIPQIKHQHHQIASLIAQGIEGVEISAITGYSPSYISILKNAPDMKQLVDYYQKMADEKLKEKSVDAIARLRSLGIASVEELQNRLNDAPEKFTVAQLTELIGVGILSTTSAPGKGLQVPGMPGGLQINLKFESAPERGDVMLDVTPKRAAG